MVLRGRRRSGLLGLFVPFASFVSYVVNKDGAAGRGARRL